MEFLGAPDLMFLEEIEDNSGEGDDGTVAADKTLDTLVEAIRNVSLSLGVGGNVSYAWAEVDPIDGLVSFFTNCSGGKYLLMIIRVGVCRVGISGMHSFINQM